MKKKSKRVSRTRKGNTDNWGVKGPSVAVPCTIAIPSGRCPFVMEDAEEETVADWVVELTNWKSSVITYNQSAYVYWVRHSFDMDTDQYRNAVTVIKRIVPEYVKSVYDLTEPVFELVG